MNQKNSHSLEIQGLRAIAVGLVLLFHVWPDAVPGGYVGVDVFFVISGYLIVGSLAREAQRDGRIDLLNFYSRRVRRLLPAASLVLACAFAGSFIWLPEANWDDALVQVVASAVYAQNWYLAWSSVDYLASDNVAGPVQHYWSLSIEEQFYIVWPLLMVALLFLARRLALPLKATLITALLAVFCASFAASVLLTAQEPEQAYFVTNTRVWELALGGLLSVIPYKVRPGGVARMALSLLGTAAVLVPSFIYSAATPFPGYTALVPTIGATMVIMAGNVRWLASRPLTYIGDRSYSVYLWHWPAITFYKASSASVGLVDGVGLIAIALALSHLSYKHIEERYRYPREGQLWRPIGYGMASIIACVLAAAMPLYMSAVDAKTATVKLGDQRYPGPASLLDNASTAKGVQSYPALGNLKHERQWKTLEDCRPSRSDATAITCIFGNPNGDKTVMIAGDSHALHWVPALDLVASERNWKLITLIKTSCALSHSPVTLRGKPYEACEIWRRNAFTKIEEIKPDILFVSQYFTDDNDDRTEVEGLRSAWRDILRHTDKIIAIRDTPRLPFNPGDCLASKPSKCYAARDKAIPRDLSEKAAKELDGVSVVNINNAICGLKRCDAVVGNLIVLRDKHHLTAAYSSALAPYLSKAILVD